MTVCGDPRNNPRRIAFWSIPPVVFLFCFPVFSCVSGPEPVETLLTIPTSPVQETPFFPKNSGGTADEIRALVESGVPSSLIRALDIIKTRGLEQGDFGRAMSAVAVTLLKRLYPDVQAEMPIVTPPLTHPYTRILREADLGIYTPPPANSQDYLEHVLPFLVFLGESRESQVLNALPDLNRARELNPRGVLAIYFIGITYERAGRIEEAKGEFTKVYTISRECYPAALELSRLLIREGQDQEGIRLLSDLVIQYPDNDTVKRQLALAYYNSRDWSRAEPAISEILQRNNRDGRFILMQAHILVERGQFLQAQIPLDLYASINPNNRLYLFLRARLQAEGYRNRDGALNYLRAILRSDPGDEEVSVYAAQLLMESNRQEDHDEGREILSRLLGAPENSGGSVREPSLEVLALALQDAIHRQAWEEASQYLNRLLTERRSYQDLLSAYTVERGLGNHAAALSYALELYEKDPSFEEGALAYIAALIDSSRQAEAGRLLESRLNTLPGGTLKSRYYYLRSRLRTNPEAVMTELRSSLFEDPRNLNSLISMFEIYHRRKDERRAVYYLKQALALAPDNPQLKGYEAEYENVMKN
ncbi:tetratricopeptide repeat domain protein [Treponema primitia ZAS-2]|uniref:Tetratricopeptide repeat domain protein n=1 Tax=Treponema primitia (strain ATCC BAA-887 / DSM 12427 / ZAS-2) TaxID=545694 RepID=F5YPG0_TREPZ|nr:hypothetical protein [Treponema primitia]AEF85014.1 tetratricopeptide repeat domain protein [Treponema primitia ZAS-2]